MEVQLLSGACGAEIRGIDLRDTSNDNIKNIKILTPREQDRRGAQISIQLRDFNKKTYSNLINSGYICDYRSPDVLRIAPTPLYNSFEDVFNFSRFLNSAIND